MNETPFSLRFLLFVWGIVALGSALAAFGTGTPVKLAYGLIVLVIGIGDLYFAFQLSKFLTPERSKYLLRWLIGTLAVNVLVSLLTSLTAALGTLIIGGLITWYIYASVKKISAGAIQSTPKQSARFVILIVIFVLLVVGILFVGGLIKGMHPAALQQQGALQTASTTTTVPAATHTPVSTAPESSAPTSQTAIHITAVSSGEVDLTYTNLPAQVTVLELYQVATGRGLSIISITPGSGSAKLKVGAPLTPGTYIVRAQDNQAKVVAQSDAFSYSAQ